jgi:hypothetical protein
MPLTRGMAAQWPSYAVTGGPASFLSRNGYVFRCYGSLPPHRHLLNNQSSHQNLAPRPLQIDGMARPRRPNFRAREPVVETQKQPEATVVDDDGNNNDDDHDAIAAAVASDDDDDYD